MGNTFPSSVSNGNIKTSVKIPSIASTAAAIWAFSTTSEPAKPVNRKDRGEELERRESRAGKEVGGKEVKGGDRGAGGVGGGNQQNLSPHAKNSVTT